MTEGSFNHYAKAIYAVNQVTKRQENIKDYLPISDSNFNPFVNRISSVRGLM